MVLPNTIARPAALTTMQRDDSRAKLMVPVPAEDPPSPPKKEAPTQGDQDVDLDQRIEAELSDKGSEKAEEPEEPE